MCVHENGLSSTIRYLILLVLASRYVNGFACNTFTSGHSSIFTFLHDSYILKCIYVLNWEIINKSFPLTAFFWCLSCALIQAFAFLEPCPIWHLKNGQKKNFKQTVVFLSMLLLYLRILTKKIEVIISIFHHPKCKGIFVEWNFTCKNMGRCLHRILAEDKFLSARRNRFTNQFSF